MKTHTNYFDEITKCLMAFQHIEEAIKIFLTNIENLTADQLNRCIYYNPKSKLQSIQNASMGRLIEMFKNYTEDTELISDLREIKKRRDFVAHQSLDMAMGEQVDEVAIHLKVLELEKDLLQSNSVFLRLCSACKNLELVLGKLT